MRGNVARDLRYGLHYMFSDDNVFEDNLFENGAAGAALMYSKRLVFRRNRFVRNRGFASVGLLLKACDDVVAEDNLIADNARGIFLEGSYDNLFRRNVVAVSDVALVIYDSSGRNTFEGNSLRRQSHAAVARRPAHRHASSTATTGPTTSEPDLDGDGVATARTASRTSSTTCAATSPPPTSWHRASPPRALGAAERAFPVLDPVPVEDASPLARAARRSRSPSGRRRAGAAPDPVGLLGAWRCSASGPACSALAGAAGARR